MYINKSDLILVWREEQIESRKEKSVGPYIVIDVDPIHKNIYVRMGAYGPLEHYSTGQENHTVREAGLERNPQGMI